MWFEQLTGSAEQDAEQMRRLIILDGGQMTSTVND
jgi:hypothetical protein